MTVTLLRLLVRLPLRWLHRCGVLLGWTVYIASPIYAARMRENLTASGIFPDSQSRERALKECIAETGKGVTEIAKVWFDEIPNVLDLVMCKDWPVVEDAQRSGSGII